MESQISPKNIEARVEAMAAASNAKPIETPAAPAIAPVEPAKPAVPAKIDAAKPAEPTKIDAAKPAEPTQLVETVKPAEPAKPGEKKAPNDPGELRKWSTKLSQENAALRDDMKTIKAALDKLTKKPVDYAELAKNPDSLKAHIEAERQEAVRELQTQLAEKHTEATRNATMYERAVRERDKENYPRWEKLFPLIQTLANNGDGRVNWNQAPGAALDEAYALAEQLSPAEVAAAAAAPAVSAPAPTPAAPVVTEEQIQARIAEAVAKAKADAAAGLRDEANGGGIGGLGKGGKRDTNVSNDALKKMPLKDLKALISKE